jgi:hypothetical protein
MFDVIVSTILIILLAPVMLLIAVLIKLESPGPIIFRQERIGEHGRRFQMLKFRTMYQDADRRWQETAGACFDYIAGEIQTPPRWMGRIGLEWLYRLMSEPRRLGHRYLVEPWSLLPLMIKDIQLRFLQRHRM